MNSEDSNISDEENYSEELDSDESSGKDWSDLEAEAAESDENRLEQDPRDPRINKVKAYNLINIQTSLSK